MGKYISIEGLIGVGKTTVLELLKSRYKVVNEPLEAWTLLQQLYEQPNVYAFPFEIQVLVSFLKHQATLDTACTTILERSAESAYFVFSKMFLQNETLNSQQFQVLTEVYQTLPLRPVDAFIFLNIPRHIALHRIHERNRETETEKVTDEYLQKLEQSYEHFKEYLLTNGVPFVNIQLNGTEDPKQVVAKVEDAIRSL
jgi:deoxyadenosine/deoxycytidine kinase